MLNRPIYCYRLYRFHVTSPHIWTAYLSSGLAWSVFLCTINKSNPTTGLDRPWGFQEVEAPRFQDIRHMNMVTLSALRTGRLYPAGNISGTHFCYRLSQLQGYSAAGRIRSIKSSNETIRNRTRELPGCSAVPQPTAPPRAPHKNDEECILVFKLSTPYSRQMLIKFEFSRQI
jgi:hypothetical protein